MCVWDVLYCGEGKSVCVCVFVRGQRRQSGQVIEAGCASLSLLQSKIFLRPPTAVKRCRRNRSSECLAYVLAMVC